MKRLQNTSIGAQCIYEKYIPILVVEHKNLLSRLDVPSSKQHHGRHMLRVVGREDLKASAEGRVAWEVKGSSIGVDSSVMAQGRFFGFACL